MRDKERQREKERKQNERKRNGEKERESKKKKKIFNMKILCDFTECENSHTSQLTLAQ